MLSATYLRSLRILDFDTECRPMHYSEWRPESQITAYAWAWTDQAPVPPTVRTLMHHDDDDMMMGHEYMLLSEFMRVYNEADIVTGHYLIKHDLPLITDHCMRLGHSLPAPKLVSDTKLDLPKVKALGLSQENLGDLFELDDKKHHMSGRKWAMANQLTDRGRKEAATRVRDDVIQHIAIRERMLKEGWLSPPQLWSP